MTDRRTDAATATVGAGGVVGGALMTNEATNRALKIKGAPKRRVANLINLGVADVAQHGTPRQRALYGAGALLSTASTAPTLVGARNLVRRRETAAKRHSAGEFLLEGLQGAAGTTGDRVETLQERKPKRATAIGLAGGSLGALGGSQLGHLGVNRAAKHKHLKGLNKPGSRGRTAAVALAGVVGAAGSIPLSNKVLDRASPGYQVTTTGVKRKKKSIVKPSSQAKVYDQRNGGMVFRQGAVPSDTFFKRKELSDRREALRRHAIIGAAGSIPVPVVNDVTSALAAGALARPENRRRTVMQQAAASQGGSLAGMAAGAYGGSALARKYPKVERGGERLMDRVDRVKAATTDKIPKFREPRYGPKRAPGRLARAATKATGPLRTSNGKMRAAALAGGLIGSTIGSQTGAYTSTLNTVRRDRRLPVKKYANSPVPLSQRERAKMARKKRYAAASSTVTGLTGLGALGAMAAKKPKWQTGLLTTGAAVGGVNSLNFAGVLRREAKAEDSKVRKSMLGLGGKAIPANRLSLTGRERVRRQINNNRLDRMMLGSHMQRRSINPKTLYEAPMPKGKDVHLVHASGLGAKSAKNWWTSYTAAYAQPNGKGGGRIFGGRDELRDKSTLAHEGAHLAPKRNPHTFIDRYQKPLQRGREEGRADFIAGRRDYPFDTPTEQRGYDEVQRWMRQNKGSRRRQLERKKPWKVDSSGVITKGFPDSSALHIPGIRTGLPRRRPSYRMSNIATRRTRTGNLVAYPPVRWHRQGTEDQDWRRAQE